MTTTFSLKIKIFIEITIFKTLSLDSLVIRSIQCDINMIKVIFQENLRNLTSSVLYIAKVQPPPFLNSNTVVLCSCPPSGVYTISILPLPGITMSVALYCNRKDIKWNFDFQFAPFSTILNN